jgi:CubicO group peptidase (beta-lactamase class C family)
MKRIWHYFAVTAVVAAALFPTATQAQTLPRTSDNRPTLPDNLLLGNPSRHHYQTATALAPSTLVFREPRGREIEIVARAQQLLANSESKSFALINGNEVVWVGYKSPASSNSRFLSMSVGKTVTAMAVGAAICEGRLQSNSRVGDLVPELADTHLGKSTVTDLLRMSSGTQEAASDSTIETPAQRDAIFAGRMSYLDLLRTERASSQHRSLFGGRQPGETFSYGTTDPLTLAVMINRATGSTYAQYVEQKVLIPAGIARPGAIGQDHFGYGQGAGNVRLTMEDWIRFAVWVKSSSLKNDCFGDYVREATRTQISNSSRTSGAAFSGYGYLIWTDNQYSTRDSFWASGYGGQRIGWNRSNNRMMVVFSNEQSHVVDLYRLYADWAALR